MKRILSLVTGIGITTSIFIQCMGGGQRPPAVEFLRDLVDGAGNIGRQYGNDIDHSIQQQQEAHEHRVQGLQEQLRDNRLTAEERIQIRNQIAREHEGERAAQNVGVKFADASVDVAKQFWSAGIDMVKQEYGAEIAKRQALITAEKQRQGMVQQTQEWIRAATDPKNAKLLVLTLSGAALGIFGAKHATALAAQMFSHWYRIPRLARETSLLSWRERISNVVYGIKPPTGQLEDVVLEPKLQERVKNTAEALKNTLKNGGYLKNVLLYGPPGTGKTMLAKRLAYVCGFDYAYFAASDLFAMSGQEALAQLKELFEYPKKSGKKMMIIIDEAENLLGNRRTKKLTADEDTKKLFTDILTYTGTETPDYMVVALTNIPEDLDDAWISRCSDQIKIDTPSPAQRREILLKYIDKYLLHPQYIQTSSASILGRMFGSQGQVKPITVQDNALSEKRIDSINSRLNGFVGRDISQLVLEWQSRAYANEGGILTSAIIDEVVTIKVEQKRAQKEGFGVTAHAAAAA